ncbi:MAG: sigma 54-interacting transcriptional regulator [Polyangia bacterium]
MATKLTGGRYAVGARLGLGAEAEVYAAHDLDGTAVVLKCVRGDHVARLRLVAEFEHLAALRCVFLPTVLSIGETGPGEALPEDALFVAMERITGDDAKSACDAAPDRANEVAKVLADASLALAALHDSGLVHHDVKPSHLLRDDAGRYRLIDLGLARSRSAVPGRVRGTLAYLSPEALIGVSEPAVDLFALGVTGHELLAGHAPYAAGTMQQLVAMMGSPRPPLQGPRALVELIEALMAPTAAERPSRAVLVADELARAGLVPRVVHAHALPGDVGFVASADGRLRVLDALERAPPVVALVGPAGSGRTRLVAELHRRRVIEALSAARLTATPRLLSPTLQQAAHALGIDETPNEGLAARVVEAASSRPTLLHLERPDEATLKSVRDALVLRAPHDLRIVLELDVETDITTIEVAPLTLAEVATITERLVGATRADVITAVAQLGRGRPRDVLALVRQAGSTGPLSPESLRAIDLHGLGAVRAAAQSLESRRALATLWLVDRPWLLPARLALDLDLAGLVVRHGERVTLESDAVGEAAFALTSDRAWLDELLSTDDLLDAAWIAHRSQHASADHRARQAVDAILDGSIRAPLVRALALAARCEPWRLGRVLFDAGRHQDAIVHIGGDRARLPTLARALRALGRRDEALALANDPGTDEIARILHIVRARLHLDAGEPFELDTEPASIPDDAWARAERQELLGLQALRQGELISARQAFEALAVLMQGATPRRRARVDGLLGMVAQADGALELAAEFYERALVQADLDGDPHGAAVYAQNLGGVLRELGEHARALPMLERAVDVLARLGRADEASLARFNLGNLQRSLGDLEAAEQAAHASAGAARVWSQLLLADIDRQRGDDEAALARYVALDDDVDDGERPYVLANRAETLADLGRAADAHATLDALGQLPLATPAAERHVRLAQARSLLALETAPLPDKLRDALDEESRSARGQHARERALRAEILLLRDAARRDAPDEVRHRLALATTLHEEILMRTPELRRAALADDPDVRRLVALLDVTRTAAPVDGKLRRLLEINKRLNSELQLDRLLELILDTVIELSRAERGFLLLRNDAGQLEVRLERNVDAQVREGVAAFSRSIAERAAAEGEPIVTVDATDDRRFEAALSIVDLHLRSVLAVPLSVKGRLIGCVYVDHRARVGLFKPEDVALVVDLAEQAAIAVENARLLADNREKEERVRALNAALEEKLATQAVELEGLHREVLEARRTLGVRHDYTGLIGNTPRMVELFRLLDRVTETALPVVIYGESGTGKELVARAIHHNGPRRKAAFVSESCAAIPETLLEAALFGHVRGAFTGAQGERRGLFEIADGGTLFLDEVGEMSPAMQVRLLRVLQEGEFRRVGGEKVLKVDVRVLVASNQDLARMVEQGRFREDLFYRLNVVRVGLPPLRERAADIPLLVEHFLSRRTDGRGITRRALDRLGRFRWPGNVRQLENELARAASLCDGTIDLADLSPQVQSGLEGSDTDGPEPLDLHGRVEKLERGLVEEALSRSAGNQSQAARLLGLSRFGLQKKMTRYGIQARR